MLVTPNEIIDRVGYEVTNDVVQAAQMMVEAYVGRVEEDVTEASDRAVMATAITFQAIYIKENKDDAFMQVALKGMTLGETRSDFVWEKFSPFMSPWAAKSCERLSWMRSRSISTGPVFTPEYEGWAARWVTE